MNDLRIRNQIQQREDQYLVSEVLVDGIPVGDFSTIATDLAALHASIASSGVYSILTCWCGEPGCAGIHHGIDVLHRDGLIHWHIREPRPRRHFQFDASAYRAAVEQALSEAGEIMRLDPPPPEGLLQVVPESNGAFLRGFQRDVSRKSKSSEQAINPASFKKVVHAAAVQLAGRVLAVHSPSVTPNFHAAEVALGDRTIFVLCSVDGNWAFSANYEPNRCKLSFVDFPPFAEILKSMFGIDPFTRAELAGEFRKQPFMSEADIKYWRPNTFGEALFNWWD